MKSNIKDQYLDEKTINLDCLSNERLFNKDTKKITLTTEISDLCKLMDGTEIRIRGFIYIKREKGERGFLIFRSGTDTIQCTYSKTLNETCCLTEEEFNVISKINLESFVEIVGIFKNTPFKIKTCTISHHEISIERLKIISKAQELPFCLKDANADEKEREKGFSNVSYNKLLDNRSLDLRKFYSQSIFKIKDNCMFAFRDFLRRKGFIEVKTPKIIETASEGGANCFKLDFFKRDAYLAQSPQLYKQLAVLGGLKRVYEIGHVYRAEESNNNRYLSEFVGLDLECEIEESYEELINLIYELLINIFYFIKTENKNELETIKNFNHFEDLKYQEKPLVFTHKQCVDFLKEIGVNMGYDEDFNRDSEKKLGSVIKEKFGYDFFVVKDYPFDVRAFYTKRSQNKYSYSFDFILRGEEILSGAHRESDYNELIKNIKEKGVNIDHLKGYLEAFKYGAPMHGGGGIGLERLLKSYFGFTDIRHFSMFPRDPTRLYP